MQIAGLFAVARGGFCSAPRLEISVKLILTLETTRCCRRWKTQLVCKPWPRCRVHPSQLPRGSSGSPAHREQLVLFSAGGPGVSRVPFPRWWLSRVTELHGQEHRDRPGLCKAEQGLRKVFVRFVSLKLSRIQPGHLPFLALAAPVP